MSLLLSIPNFFDFGGRLGERCESFRSVYLCSKTKRAEDLTSALLNNTVLLFGVLTVPLFLLPLLARDARIQRH